MASTTGIDFYLLEPANDKSKPITCIQISPQPHTFVAVGEVGGCIKVYERGSPFNMIAQIIPTVPNGICEATTLAWNPSDSNEFHVGYSNGDISGHRFYNLESDGEYTSTVIQRDIRDTQQKGPVNHLALSQDGSIMGAIIHRRPLLIHRDSTGGVMKTTSMDCGTCTPWRLAFYRQGGSDRMILAMHHKKDHVTGVIAIRVPALNSDDTVETLWKIETRRDFILSFAISPDQSRFAIIYAFGGLEIYATSSRFLASCIAWDDAFAPNSFPVDVCFIHNERLVIGNSRHRRLFLATVEANGGVTIEKISLRHAGDQRALSRLDGVALTGGEIVVVTGESHPEASEGGILFLSSQVTSQVRGETSRTAAPRATPPSLPISPSPLIIPNVGEVDVVSRPAEGEGSRNPAPPKKEAPSPTSHPGEGRGGAAPAGVETPAPTTSPSLLWRDFHGEGSPTSTPSPTYTSLPPRTTISSKEASDDLQGRGSAHGSYTVPFISLLLKTIAAMGILIILYSCYPSIRDGESVAATPSNYPMEARLGPSFITETVTETVTIISLPVASTSFVTHTTTATSTFIDSTTVVSIHVSTFLTTETTTTTEIAAAPSEYPMEARLGPSFITETVTETATIISLPVASTSFVTHTTTATSTFIDSTTVVSTHVSTFLATETATLTVIAQTYDSTTSHSISSGTARAYRFIFVVLYILLPTVGLMLRHKDTREVVYGLIARAYAWTSLGNAQAFLLRDFGRMFTKLKQGDPDSRTNPGQVPETQHMFPGTSLEFHEDEGDI